MPGLPRAGKGPFDGAHGLPRLRYSPPGDPGRAARSDKGGPRRLPPFLAALRNTCLRTSFRTRPPSLDAPPKDVPSEGHSQGRARALLVKTPRSVSAGFWILEQHPRLDRRRNQHHGGRWVLGELQCRCCGGTRPTVEFTRSPPCHASVLSHVSCLCALPRVMSLCSPTCHASVLSYASLHLRFIPFFRSSSPWYTTIATSSLPLHGPCRHLPPHDPLILLSALQPRSSSISPMQIDDNADTHCHA